MKVLQFVETTKQRYDDHVVKVRNVNTYGGRWNVSEYDDDQVSVVRTYHNEAISDIGQAPQWQLVGLAIYHRHLTDDRSSPRAIFNQYFILEEVEMGVTTTQIGLNGQEEK